MTNADMIEAMIDDVFGKIYAHCVIKYDPEAAKRVIRDALTTPSKVGAFYAVEEININKKYKWCLVEVIPEKKRIIKDFGWGGDAKSRADAALVAFRTADSQFVSDITARDLAVVQPELDRLRAENEALRRVGNDALTVLKFAFNRIHVLPRSRDTELANDIDKVLGRLRAALSAPAHDGEGR